MAYVPPIQLRPVGLMGFFDIKRGEAPKFLPETVQAELDLLSWYLETHSEVIISPIAETISATGTTSFGFTVVPQSEWWYVSSWNIRATSGAGEAMTFQAAAVMRSQIFALGDPVGMGAVENRNAFMSRPSFFLPPGDGLVAEVVNLTGVIDIVPAARITRLPIS